MITGPLADLVMRRRVRQMVPQLEAEVTEPRPLVRRHERRDAAAGRRGGPRDGAGVSAVAAAPRARLEAGLAEAIAEKGYAAATIADVVRHARVSKRTFYEHFADKEECFLALYSDSSDELLALIAEAAWGDEPAGRG